MKTPIKPFPNYKWRWAELTPSEGLNNPIRLIGVLRAMYKHQGEAKSTNAIYTDLEKVERETNQLTGEKVTLARIGERNLFRNSDRYWKAVGLLDSESRNIQLTPFGIKVAEGKITQNEFAISIIKTLTLPNKNIETDITEWQNAGIELKPLELILQIVKLLYDNFGETQAYISSYELQKIVIPIAGSKFVLEDYIKALIDFRSGNLDISLFPDCSPRSNDERMVREFLLFLSNYGFCQLQKGKTNREDKFFLQPAYLSEIEEITNLKTQKMTLDNVVQKIRENPIILDIERQKILTKVLARPYQAKFRKQVLTKFNNTCILTGEKLNIVLEACHIIPIEHKGSDSFANGFCMRADVHVLFDSKHIRFNPNGNIEYSETLQQSISYRNLPSKIIIPNFISHEALSWRYDYY